MTEQTPPKVPPTGNGGSSAAAPTNHESAAKAATERKHALAVAVATAEAAMATAQAAVEVARLTRPANHARGNYAAIVIQTAFRGYLVRSAVYFSSNISYKRKDLAKNCFLL